MSWKVCWFQERNVLAGLVPQRLLICTDSKDLWNTSVEKARGWVERVAEPLQNHFAFGSRPWGFKVSVCKKDVSIEDVCRSSEWLRVPAGCSGLGCTIKPRQTWGPQSTQLHQGTVFSSWTEAVFSKHLKEFLMSKQMMRKFGNG